MGFWGLGLYDNDTTSDVKAFCECQYWGGLESVEVQKKALKKFSDLIGTEEEPLLWFVLADVQWHFNDVVEETKNKALSLIENHAFSENFDNSKDRKEWEKTLLSLKKIINKELPPSSELWQLAYLNCKIGDVFAYQFNSVASKRENLYEKYILFQILGEEEEIDYGCVSVRVQFFKNIFDKIPYGVDVKDLEILPMDIADYYLNSAELPEPPITITINMISIDGDLPKKRITLINNQSIANKEILILEEDYIDDMYWSHFEKTLCNDYIPSWKNHSLVVKNNELVVV